MFRIYDNEIYNINIGGIKAFVYDFNFYTFSSKHDHFLREENKSAKKFLLDISL